MNEGEFLKTHAQTVFKPRAAADRNASDAEDLARTRCCGRSSAAPRFAGTRRRPPGLYRITVNTWKNRVRSEKRRSFWRHVPSRAVRGGDETASPGTEGGGAAAGRRLETEETSRAVQGALLALEEESRAVVVLREIEGLSYGQISSALGIPEGTVKSRLSRAREALKARLKAFGKARG